MITINCNLSNQLAPLPLGSGALDEVHKGAGEDRPVTIGGWLSSFVIEQVISVIAIAMRGRGRD
jgi:hypothetical protein